MKPYESLLNPAIATGPEMEALQQQLVQDPDNGTLWYQLGLSFRKEFAIDQALLAMECCVQLCPEDGMALFKKGHFKINLGRYAEAIEDLEKADRLLPMDKGVWYHLSLAHFLSGSYEKAAACYETCLACKRTESGLYALGELAWYYNTLMKLGRRQEADQMLADRFDPKEPAPPHEEFYYDICMMYSGRKYPHDCWREVGQTSDLQRTTVGYGVFRCYEMRGDGEQASAVIGDLYQSLEPVFYGFAQHAIYQAAKEYGLR